MDNNNNNNNNKNNDNKNHIPDEVNTYYHEKLSISIFSFVPWFFNAKLAFSLSYLTIIFDILFCRNYTSKKKRKIMKKRKKKKERNQN